MNLSRLAASLAAVTCCAVSSPSSAVERAEEIEGPKAVISAWSTDLVDPAGLTRVHLTTRAMFSDGKSAFAAGSAWSYEAHGSVRLTEGWAASAMIPLGMRLSAGGAQTKTFFGNAGVGITGGGYLTNGPGPLLRIAGGLDVFFPTAPEPTDLAAADAQGLIAAIRSYEPYLYVPKLLSFRLRAHSDVEIDIFTGELELGLIPAVTLSTRKDFVMLFSAAVRGSADVSETIEPYFEIACTPQIGGKGDISPPLLLTPGVRFHIADIFDPAIFFSFNFVEPSAIVFGVDLATVVRPTKEERKVRDTDEFLNFD